VRTKLSTTVSVENYRFLERKIHSGEAANLAEAIDRVIRRVRRLENRERLAEATARYFDGLDARAVAEENELAHDFSSAAGEINFDEEL